MCKSIKGVVTMRILEHYWLSNRNWWKWENGTQVIKDSAPPEAQESYKHYLEQIKSKRGIS